MTLLRLLVAAAALALCAHTLHAQITIDVESGWTVPGYNTVRVPGAGGTQFSLTRDFDADGQVFGRARLSWQVGSRHHLSALWAPLSLDATGMLPGDVLFESTAFPAGTPLTARYAFNSYRLTWRYDLQQTPRLTFGIGVTAKVRDAEVALTGGGQSERTTDVGVVPLVNVHFDLRATARTGLLIGGDALAAPQGRAIDMLAAAWWEPAERARLRFGYRVLEGGVDNDEVFNFALFHYAVAGVELRW